MQERLGSVITAMAGGSREPVGWFEYDVPSNVWTWSPDLFRIHGFEPGEIVPTTEVLLAHKHPEDRNHTDQVLDAVLATGQPFCCRHRIITTRQQERTVITIGQGVLDNQRHVVTVHGYFVDITDAARHASTQEIQDAVDKSAGTRADIEQAKGALMIVQGVSADDAFAILRWISSHANIKLRDIAQFITNGMQHPATPTETPNQRLGRLLGGLASDSQMLKSIPTRRSVP